MKKTFASFAEAFRVLGLIGGLALAACATPTPSLPPPSVWPTDRVRQTLMPSGTATELAPTWLAPTRTPKRTRTPVPPTPTLDPPRPRASTLSLLGEGWAVFSYTVKADDTLGTLAARYGLSYDQIRLANGFKGGEVLLPGQALLIPQKIQKASPTFKLIPDSELIYSPGALDFDPLKFVARYPGGYLYHYTELVNGEEMSGAALIQRAAQLYSVNPRLLLSLLEYQSGWLTAADPGPNAKLYPFGRAEGGTEGLFRQLQWVANALNGGFYQWRAGSLSLLILSDGTRVGLSEGLNAGTASLYYVFSLTQLAEAWEPAVSPPGFFSTYTELFGNPFARTVEPLVIPSLSQPELTLPWQGGETWFYSGGPHASFGSGSPWGAIDFLPPGRDSGCAVSLNWVTAVAPGVVARSGAGQLALDLDADGHEQTGWVILYLHLAEQDRPPVGTRLNRGDHVGHASCEGGQARDAHVHLARKYNGVWLAADDPLAAFILGGYTVRPTGSEYNGWLEGFDVTKQACACRNATNAITK